MISIKREYSMSNADLCILASNFVVFITRDSTQFAARGVNAGAKFNVELRIDFLRDIIVNLNSRKPTQPKL